MMKTRRIKGFENYSISKNGDIFNKNGRKLKPGNCRGYKNIHFRKNGKQHTRKVHRLVLETFAGPCPKGMETNHKNGIKTDNRLENLEWVTSSENTKHALSTGLINRSYEGLIEAGVQYRLKPKLKAGEVWLIKKLIFHKKEHGLSFRKTGQMFKVTRAAIYWINAGKSWNNIQYQSSR